MPFAEEVLGPAVESLSQACRRLGVCAVMGLLERTGDRLFNAAVLVGPQGLVGSYRKVHLPFLGIDRFNTRGNRRFQVWDIGGSRICDPSGQTLASEAGDGEAVLVAEIDPARARQQQLIRVPGKHEVNRIADRRPEFYGKIVEPRAAAVAANSR